MNIIKRELKANLKSLIIWSLVILIIITAAAVEFSAFKDLANVDEILKSFPKEFRTAFSFDTIRFDKPEGYYSYMGQYFMVMAVIYAVLLGTKILSKEISKKTAETIFTLPITRRYLISMKLIAAIINCALFALVIFSISYGVFSYFDIDKLFVQRLLIFSLLILLMQVLFVLVGLFGSVITKSHKRIGTTLTSITVGLFIITYIAKMGEKYKFLEYFTPFEYFSAIDIMHGHKLKLFGFIVVPLLIVTFFLISFGLVEKKDIL